MGVLQRFERRLEGLVGNAFARLFKGQVEPVEVAKALQREAEEKRAIVGNGRVLVPNRYVVELGSTDYDRLAPWEAQLTQTLAEMVQEHVDDEGWSTFGDIEVSLTRADDLPTGVFRINSGVDPDAGPRRRPVYRPEQDFGAAQDYVSPRDYGPGGDYAPDYDRGGYNGGPDFDRAPDYGPAPAGSGMPGGAGALGAAGGALAGGALPGPPVPPLPGPPGGPGFGPGGPGGPGGPAPGYEQGYADRYGYGGPGSPYGQPSDPYGQPAQQPYGGAGGGYGPPQQQQYPPQRGGAVRHWLIVDGTERRVEVELGTTTVGRGQDAELRLADTGVSRRHLEVRYDGQVATLHDLGSTNGTVVNGHRVQSWQLQNGDVIRLGHSVLVYRQDRG